MNLEDFFDVLDYRERKDEPKDDYMEFRKTLFQKDKSADVPDSH